MKKEVHMRDHKLRAIGTLILAILLSVTLIGCNNKHDSNTTETSTTDTHMQESISVEETPESESESTVDFSKYDEDIIKLSTPYVTLEYPVKWNGVVATETFENESSYTVKFYAYLDYQYISLADFVIGNSSDGIILGTIDTASGEIPIYLIDYSAHSGNYLSQASKDIFFQMSEEVNIIISNLIYNSGMRV